MKAVYAYITNALEEFEYPVYQQFAPPGTEPPIITFSLNVRESRNTFSGVQLVVASLEVDLWMESEEIGTLETKLKAIIDRLDKQQFTLVDYNKEIACSILLLEGPTIRKSEEGFLDGNLTFSVRISK